MLLLEAGGLDRHPYFAMPAGFAKMTKGIASWGYSTVPQKHLDGRVLWYTQAKVIGGGSSINAQVYTRGNAEDYDGWAYRDRCTGWAYADVLPYFKRAEDNQRFTDAYHALGRAVGRVRPGQPAADLRGLPARRRRNTASPTIRTSTARGRRASATTR